MKSKPGRWKSAPYVLAFSGIMVILYIVSAFWHTTIAAPDPLPTPAVIDSAASSPTRSTVSMNHPSSMGDVHIRVHPHHVAPFMDIVEHSATRQGGMPMNRIEINPDLTQVRLLTGNRSIPELRALDSPRHTNQMSHDYQAWARSEAENATKYRAPELVIYSVLVTGHQPTGANRWLVRSSFALAVAGMIAFTAMWATASTPTHGRAADR